MKCSSGGEAVRSWLRQVKIAVKIVDLTKACKAVTVVVHFMRGFEEST